MRDGSFALIGDWMVPPVLVPLFLAVLALAYGWLRT
jgi:hypothetical protein